MPYYYYEQQFEGLDFIKAGYCKTTESFSEAKQMQALMSNSSKFSCIFHLFGQVVLKHSSKNDKRQRQVTRINKEINKQTQCAVHK